MESHALKAEDVLRAFDSGANGISANDAEQRLAKYGRNELESAEKINIFKIIIGQFKSALVLLLIAAAIISYSIGFLPGQEPREIDMILILAIVIANAIFGFVQDFKAEKSLALLKKIAAPKAIVIRNGERQTIDSELVVPGDVIVLSEGNKVVADARIILSQDLDADESILTGESAPVSKITDAIDAETQLAERVNMVFSNTSITRGSGLAVAVATGMQTETGKIASELKKAEEKNSPFDIEISNLGKKITFGIVILIAIIAVTNLALEHLPLIETMLVSISLAVAAIPEGLPAVVTIALAMGTQRMLKKNALARKLAVVESLGAVDVICSDKTGTMTQNRMAVTRVYSNFREQAINSLQKDFENEMVLRCGLLCNDSAEGKDGNYIGDPTETALLVSGHALDISSDKYERVKTIAFSSERKMMTTVHEKDGKLIAFSKGATEILLEKCSQISLNGKAVALDSKTKMQIIEQNNRMAGNALRILAFAYREIRETNSEIENEMVFLGLQGMIDPPRNEVKDSIELCRSAGIRVVMITGDNLTTAKAIAREIGIGQNAIEGKTLDRTLDTEFGKIVETTDIFARVSPQHKVLILNALKKNGQVVAMTGDGINDAPAIKQADVGIAMGKKGTDIAREASDMVLLDDNFATIVSAVREGRTIFANIRKFVNFLLGSNASEVMVVFIASLFGFLPVTAIQILWINLMTDGLPALALAIDPADSEIMKHKPRPKNEGVVNKKTMILIGANGLMLTAILLAVFYICLPSGIVMAQTAVFTGFVIYEFLLLASIRREEKLTLLSNKWLLAAVAGAIALQLFVVYGPFSGMFGVTALGLFEWSVLAAGFAVGWIVSAIINHFVE